jgi:hypothetical protein
MIQNSILTMAEKLAQSHRKADPRTTHVFLSEDPEGQEIRLVEVSEGVPNSGGVMPFRFRSAPEHQIDLPSVVVLLHPSEWEELRSGHLSLPTGWSQVDELEEIALPR